MQVMMQDESFRIGTDRPAVGFRLRLGLLGEISLGVEHKQSAAPATAALIFLGNLGPFEVLGHFAWLRSVLQASDHDSVIDVLSHPEVLLDALVFLSRLELLVLGGLEEVECDFVEAVDDGVVQAPEVGQVAMPLDVRPALHQNFDCVFMLVEDCCPEGREAVDVGVVHTHSTGEEQFDHVVSSPAAGLCQQGASPVDPVGEVVIGLQYGLHCCKVVALDKVGEIVGAVV